MQSERKLSYQNHYESVKETDLSDEEGNRLKRFFLLLAEIDQQNKNTAKSTKEDIDNGS